MSIDMTAVGHLTADLMDDLEKVDGIPEGAKVEEAIIVMAVSWPIPGDSESVGSSVFFRSTTAKPWVLFGLLSEGARSVENSRSHYDPDEHSES